MEKSRRRKGKEDERNEVEEKEKEMSNGSLKDGADDERQKLIGL